jgi:hypothetical protein
VSDIAIRLDGLLLGMCMVAGAVLFAAISAAAALRTWTKPKAKRSWKIAARSSGLAFINAVGLALLALYLSEYEAPAVGPGWIDWLSLPWLGSILFGLILLVRSRPRT